MRRAVLHTSGLLMLLLAPPGVDAEHPLRLYWTDGHGTSDPFNGTIDRAVPESGKHETVSMFPHDIPVGFAFDVPRRKMYWITSISDSILRANLDGTNVETVWDGSELLATPVDIAIDSAGGKMYWTDQVMDSIRRANLDGTEVEDIVLINPPVNVSSAVYGIDLDLTAGKVYWTDWRLDKVQRANLDGSDVEDLIVGVSKPVSIALDVPAGKMYFVKFDTSIARANLDGSNIETVVIGTRIDSVSLDLDAGKLYWLIFNPMVLPGTGKLRRSNLDGTDVEDVIPTGLVFPLFMDILPVEVSLADYARYFSCATGPGVPFVDPDCAPLDYDHDKDIDLLDFALLQAAFTGVF